MNRLNERIRVAIPAFLALAMACGGSTAPPSPASELGTTACDHYVGALLGVTCPWGPVLPPSEVARLQQTFVPVCQNAKQAPDSTLTDAKLDACASALEAQCQLGGVLPSAGGVQLPRFALAGRAVQRGHAMPEWSLRFCSIAFCARWGFEQWGLGGRSVRRVRDAPCGRSGVSLWVLRRRCLLLA